MIGVDEVGRGCLAGPLLVVAARATQDLPDGLKDSKLLTKRQRQNFYKHLVKACSYGEGWVTAAEINKIGLARALKLGVKRALVNLGVRSDEEILMDGSVNYVPTQFNNSRCEIKADNKYAIVSAASIIAKVKRDKYMTELAKKYPDYNFDKHVGYGTKAHHRAIELQGPLEGVHRIGFAPFKYIGESTAA